MRMRRTAFTFATCHQARSETSALARATTSRRIWLRRAGMLMRIAATASAGPMAAPRSASTETPRWPVWRRLDLLVVRHAAYRTPGADDAPDVARALPAAQVLVAQAARPGGRAHRRGDRAGRPRARPVLRLRRRADRGRGARPAGDRHRRQPVRDLPGAHHRGAVRPGRAGGGGRAGAGGGAGRGGDAGTARPAGAAAAMRHWRVRRDAGAEIVAVHVRCPRCGGTRREEPLRSDLQLSAGADAGGDGDAPRPPVFAGWQTRKLVRAGLTDFGELFTTRNLRAFATLRAAILAGPRRGDPRLPAAGADGRAGAGLADDGRPRPRRRRRLVEAEHLLAAGAQPRARPVPLLREPPAARRGGQARDGAAAGRCGAAAVRLRRRPRRWRRTCPPARSPTRSPTRRTAARASSTPSCPRCGAPGSIRRSQPAHDDEIGENPHRGRDRDAFAAGLLDGFRAVHRALVPGGRMTVTFASRDPRSWQALDAALAGAGFRVDEQVEMGAVGAGPDGADVARGDAHRRVAGVRPGRPVGLESLSGRGAWRPRSSRRCRPGRANAARAGRCPCAASIRRGRSRACSSPRRTPSPCGRSRGRAA